MKSKRLRFTAEFQVGLGNRCSQMAEMTLAPGDSEGDSRNRHRGSDQWLFVVSGAGKAVVNGKRLRLRENTILLIERGDSHEIKNTGKKPLRTLNIYVPPAYGKSGDPLPRGGR